MASQSTRSQKKNSKTVVQHDRPAVSDSGEYVGFGQSLKSYRWTLRARFRLFLLVLTGSILIPLQMLMLRLLPRFWWHIPALWLRMICRIVGLQVTRVGAPANNGPVLFVANHISWLDIFLLGGYLPGASFVAKSEIEGWGLAGFLSRLHRTIFIARHNPRDSARQRDQMMSRLKAGGNLTMFPEGTSTEGTHVAPFKSSLFSVAEQGDEATDHKLYVQPVTISYVEHNGMPLVRSQRPLVAWLGDEELISHVRHYLASGRVRAVIEFHAPVHMADVGNRKQMAQYCHRTISDGLERAHRHVYSMGPQPIDPNKGRPDGGQNGSSQGQALA